MKMTIKTLIARECPNHQREGSYGVANWCLKKGAVCLIFTHTPRPCECFEDGVLPACPEVGAEYRALVGQDIDTKVIPIRRATCRVCGEAFKTTSNRQQYCSEACAQLGGREKDKDLKRRRRRPRSEAA